MNSLSGRDAKLTRRDALGILGAGAVAAAVPGAALGAEPVFPPGAIIRTVLRDYKPSELAGGATLFHEHLSLAPDLITRLDGFTAEARAKQGLPPVPAAPNDPFTHDLALMTNELVAAKREGVACIVDGGQPDMGRDINALRELSKRSGMPVVAGGGFYLQPFYPKTIGAMSEAQIVEALLKQVADDGVGVFGEIGSFDFMTADERKVFRAIAKAHLATNFSIFTHTGPPGKAALEQLDILEDAGVHPSRIAIGHLGNPLVDINVHKEICRRGAFVGFDRLGRPAEDPPQVPMLMALLEAGFADNLLFASDLARSNALKRADPKLGYGKTLTQFLPMMRAAGANDAVLRQITVDNSRRFLAFVPKR